MYQLELPRNLGNSKDALEVMRLIEKIHAEG